MAGGNDHQRTQSEQNSNNLHRSNKAAFRIICQLILSLWNWRESESKFCPMIEVRYDRGVHLPHQGLWLDPWDPKRFAFVSHAHSDHIAAHQEVIVSERTARLMQSRLPGSRTEHVMPFGQKRTVHGLELMLLPAGHILGSS